MPLLPMEIAGACPPRYGNIETGRALLPRSHRDREVSPTGIAGGCPSDVERFMKPLLEVRFRC